MYRIRSICKQFVETLPQFKRSISTFLWLLLKLLQICSFRSLAAYDRWHPVTLLRILTWFPDNKLSSSVVWLQLYLLIYLLMRCNHVGHDVLDEGPEGLVWHRPPPVKIGLTGPHSCRMCFWHTVLLLKVKKKPENCLLEAWKSFDFDNCLLNRGHVAKDRENPQSHDHPVGGGCRLKPAK